MSAWSTRFFTKRIEDGLLAGQDILRKDAQEEYAEAAEKVADEWGNRIRASGRGGSHNAEMSNINHQVTQPRSGAFFVRVGWFDPAGPMAADGKTSWFVYHDTGYRAFGKTWVPGLMIQLDMRQKLELEIREANERLAGKVTKAIRSGR